MMMMMMMMMMMIKAKCNVHLQNVEKSSEDKLIVVNKGIQHYSALFATCTTTWVHCMTGTHAWLTQK